MDFRLPFISKSSVGLYIGPKTIQLAQLKAAGKKIQLVNFVHVDIYEDEQRSDSSSKDDLVIAALRKAVYKAKIDLRQVNTILMPGMVLLRYFQMPRISSEEMEEAVRFEARKYIPFRLEEAVTGFYILKDDQESKKLGILSLVTKEESIKNHLVVLNKVSINPTAIETASFALLRLLEYSQEIDKQSSNVVVYLYAQRVNVIILKNGVPYFVRDVSLAKKEEWIDDETAQFIMDGEVISVDSRATILRSIISELRISLEYYKKELGKEDITKIILIGEIDDFDDLEEVMTAAQEEPDNPWPLAVYLHLNFDIPVSTIDPLKNILSPKAKPLPYTFAMLPVTIGAGLRNLAKSTVEIDLFKARKRPSMKAKVFLNKMVLVEIGALIMSLVLLFAVFSIFVSREKNLLEKEKLNSPKFVDLSHFSEGDLKRGEDEIKKRLEVYDRFANGKTVLTHKLNVIPRIMAEGIWLTGLSFNARAASAKQQGDNVITLEFAGNVYSEQKGLEIEIVNAFTEKLKVEEKFFQGFKMIKTGSVTRTDYQGVPSMSFVLNCSSDIRER